jgi:phage terminase large subunit
MKSHYFAGALIEEHLCTGGFRSVCIREIQKTLGSSSKQLLEDKLREFKLTRAGQGFKVFNDVIQTPQDGLILFQGMQDHTADSIKSLEGMDLAWVEEAQTITERSLNMLRPTIRKKGSRLWFGWNPRRKTDAVDKFFRSAETPTNSIILKTGWQHNPWWTAELEQERLDDLRINPDQYDHIWEGGYISVANGAYFAQHLQQARLENRIGKVNVDPLLRKYAFIDIGGTGANSDAFTMWIVQFVGKEIRVLNYYEVIGQPLAAHVTWLRTNAYDDAVIVLPHDGRQHDKVYKVTYESSFKDLGFNVIVIPNQGAGAANMRIEAVRGCFHDCYFDEIKCAAGLEALGWYHEKKDANRNIGLGADHDWSSHGADSFGLMAITRNKLSKPRDTRKIALINNAPSDSIAGY